MTNFKRQDVFLEEIRSQKSYAAVDVETNTAGRHNRLGIIHVESRHVPDGEPVA